MNAANAAAELAARSAYGRLLALLAARSRDIAGAEDALSEALLSALETWPRDGVPANPDAWLFTAARRRSADASRRAKVRLRATSDLELLALERGERGEGAPFPDERLKLLFVAAHPAIDDELRPALLLQTVLGLSAERIAGAYRVAPKTMGQRLWRAKAKIRDAGVGFELPEPAELPERIASVLESLYAAYGAGWDDLLGADRSLKGLAEEAIFLTRLLVTLLPSEPEARGLLALMLYSEARRGARRSPEGHYVPLSEQDTALWDAALIAEAETELAAASRHGEIGAFQLEAAIQSAHAARARNGRVDHDALITLYETLITLAPTLGARLGHAAALAAARGPHAGLEALSRIEPELSADYQPYWALLGHLLQRAHDPRASNALERAAGLTEDPALRQFLLAKREGR